MYNWLFYKKKQCASCGRWFDRARTRLFVWDWLSIFFPESIIGKDKEEEKYSAYVCSMGCALSYFSKSKSK
jgi:hypothetical protein